MAPRAFLLPPTQSLCKAFSTSAPLETLLSTFTTCPPPQIHEHGLPCLAPFLGRTFTGRDGVTEYVTLLNESLGIEKMEFDDVGEWVVDTESMVVCLRGGAKFVAKRSGERWDERFMYRISVAEEQGGNSKGVLKVREYEVWADTGAAYLAMRGELERGLGRE
ncbi:hypothetical protein BDW59DRAFT_158033 [Aspergillus cavernicola]|uniref:SnoaL-like domain-containing protein n=1 Tax=Aspergillus cavernicola TaxID=176166 RepID=A0ABR4ITU2_9EURO